MHARPTLLTALAALLLAAGPVLAQTKPAKRIAPAPRPPAEATLPASKPAAVVPSPAPSLRLGGLVGMSPVGDPAPACRAQCSKERYVCHAANDPTDCDSRWIPCLHACSVR